MIILFVNNSSTSEEELVDRNSIVLGSVAFYMTYMVNQHDYVTINIDKPEAEVFYDVQLTPMSYILQY